MEKDDNPREEKEEKLKFTFYRPEDQLSLRYCKNVSKTDMGEPVVKASGRTFKRIHTPISDPCWSSLQGISSHSLETSNRPPSEALKSGLAMAVCATGGLYQENFLCEIMSELAEGPDQKNEPEAP